MNLSDWGPCRLSFVSLYTPCVRMKRHLHFSHDMKAFGVWRPITDDADKNRLDLMQKGVRPYVVTLRYSSLYAYAILYKSSRWLLMQLLEVRRLLHLPLAT